MHRELWLWGILVVAGCKDDGNGGSSVGPVPEDQAPETAVNVICGQFESCGCDPANAAPDGCEASIDEQVRQAQGDATAAGLEYDADCMGSLLSSFHDIECRTTGDLSLDEALAFARRNQQCKIFYGTAEPGEACEILDDGDLGDSCRKGALCYESVCVEITAPAADGEDCDPALEALACAGTAICLDLDGDERPTCVKLPQEGDPCLTVLVVQVCGEGLACENELCIVAPGNGQPCHEGDNACAVDLECNLETRVCQPLPTGGEPCTLDCAGGFDCVDDRCVALEPIVCDVGIYDEA